MDAFVAVLEDYFEQGEKLCVMGSLAVSLAREDAAVDLKRGFQSWIRSLSKLLVAIGCPKAEANHRAEQAVALFQGAIVLARGTGDAKLFRRLAKRTKDQLVAGL